jgi:hypothetical protein
LQADGQDGEDAEEDGDPYDLLDPVAILDRIPSNFYEMVRSLKSFFLKYIFMQCFDKWHVSLSDQSLK